MMLYRASKVSGIDVVPNLPKCPVPVLMLCRSYRSVQYRYESRYRCHRYRYSYRTELTEVSGTAIDIVQNSPKCPVPVIPPVYTTGMPRYRTEHTLIAHHVPGIPVPGGLNLRRRWVLALTPTSSRSIPYCGIMFWYIRVPYRLLP